MSQRTPYAEYSGSSLMTEGMRDKHPRAPMTDEGCKKLNGPEDAGYVVLLINAIGSSADEENN